MPSSSALPKDIDDNEPDWRVVYYELDLESIGPAWDIQVAAALNFQEAYQRITHNAS